MSATQSEMLWGEALETFLKRLSDTTEVEHQAMSPYHEHPLTALNATVALDRMHRILARTYRLTWRTSESKPLEYFLGEGSVDRRARSEARAKAEAEGRRQMMVRLDQVRRMAFMSQEELRRLADPKAKTLQHHRTGPMARLLFQLPQQTWQQFWQTGTATISVSDLPVELQDLAKSAAGHTKVTFSTGEEYRISDRVVAESKLRLQRVGTFDRPTIWGQIKTGIHMSGHNLLYAEGHSKQPPQERRQQARARPSRAPDAPVFRRKVTLRDSTREVVLFPGERPKGALPLVPILDQLARQVPIPLIAECEYRRKEKDKDGRWIRDQWWMAADIVERPLAEALDLLCADFEYEWEYREGALLFRPTRWYLEMSKRGYRQPDTHWDSPALKSQEQ